MMEYVAQRHILPMQFSKSKWSKWVQMTKEEEGGPRGISREEVLPCLTRVKKKMQ